MKDAIFVTLCIKPEHKYTLAHNPEQSWEICTHAKKKKDPEVP